MLILASTYQPKQASIANIFHCEYLSLRISFIANIFNCKIPLSPMPMEASLSRSFRTARGLSILSALNRYCLGPRPVGVAISCRRRQLSGAHSALLSELRSSDLAYSRLAPAQWQPTRASVPTQLQSRLLHTCMVVCACCSCSTTTLCIRRLTRGYTASFRGPQQISLYCLQSLGPKYIQEA